MEWQPIETAPKDGTTVFVWYEASVKSHGDFDNRVRLAKWIECLGEWQVHGVGGNVPPKVTHWMPIPNPPSPAS